MYEFELFNRYVSGTKGLVLGGTTISNENTICYKALEADNYLGGRALAAKYLSGGEGNSVFELTWDVFKNDAIVSQQHWWDIYYHNLPTDDPEFGLKTELSEWEDALNCLLAYANPKGGPADTPNLAESMRDVLSQIYDKEYCTPSTGPIAREGKFQKV